ncbi:4-(cytidine 5'-diphospho)-2-C-methyl-D-erythritol kinase [Rhizobium sp. LCM 4573]|uniref:4-(cytidine 5'-diphospho)-2-C-methyl-D-erythritol kinase n=1 Tax=Rhizobium sp. LCM 4573 TaxID=1848291 RepID=UPI0008D9D185|nr:4-(cytidine 5'-diphospho)-2-C-methyl-D-erythritol kinase [Rhizobium sp. LCM 4573]OHV75880.1 4-(cytidine 5'-diphospho)-2-C-methyl-D-erythritol kinase [Rhizobium sp. LCM 4573]
MPSGTHSTSAGREAGATLFEPAPAKINLALHVVGQRADGYHLLESIVTFAKASDRLSFSPAADDDFSVSGRFGVMLSGDPKPNLVLAARDRLRQAVIAAGGEAPPVTIHLEKNLPIAAGIGGGSADAAATLRGLMRLWNAHLPETELAAIALSLGADVPMCLKGAPSMARGIGEELTPLASLPSFALVLGNPLIGVSTPDIFRYLARRDNPPIEAQPGDWLSYLTGLRNDLEQPAKTLVPEIGELTAMIEAEGALLTRMSGSGATCFGIFSSIEAAEIAAENLGRRKPGWYFQAAETVAGNAA